MKSPQQYKEFANTRARESGHNKLNIKKNGLSSKDHTYRAADQKLGSPAKRSNLNDSPSRKEGNKKSQFANGRDEDVKNINRDERSRRRRDDEKSRSRSRSNEKEKRF